MSFVWRIWIRPGARAAPVTDPPMIGVGADVATQLAATTSAATRRRMSGLLADGLVSAVLQFVESMVDAVLLEQLAVRADLDDPTLVQDDDPIDVLDRR